MACPGLVLVQRGWCGRQGIAIRLVQDGTLGGACALTARHWIPGGEAAGSGTERMPAVLRDPDLHSRLARGYAKFEVWRYRVTEITTLDQMRIRWRRLTRGLSFALLPRHYAIPTYGAGSPQPSGCERESACNS